MSGGAGHGGISRGGGVGGDVYIMMKAASTVVMALVVTAVLVAPKSVG